MRSFDLYDHVQLKNDPTLHGTVERTNSPQSYDPLDAELIIAHVQVPDDVLNAFVTTGVPPSGYVFVQFEDACSGSSLVAEEDLTFLSRSFQIGDTVRQEGKSVTGTVTNVDESYVLQPILSLRTSVPDQEGLTQEFNTCTSECAVTLPEQSSVLNQHVLLRDVPGQEVRRAQDIVRDDFILTNNWVGTVEDVQYDIVLLLANGSIVQIRSFHGLHIPVRANGKALIALPEDEEWRPDVVGALQGWATTIPIYHVPRPGSFVIVDRTRLRKGNWIQGSYSPQCPTHGRILNIRAGEVSVDWADTNVSVQVSTRHDHGEPPHEFEYYDKTGTPSLPETLFPRSDMIVYDSGIRPTNSHSAGSCIGGGRPDVYSSISPNVQEIPEPPLGSGQGLLVGTHVRFRDPTAAAAKYQGTTPTSHGAISKIDRIHGWDLDEYKVVHIKQTATVLWQDGSTSSSDSSLLQSFNLFEPEIAPTDIVLKRAGMQQKAIGSRNVKSFNEMTFFEQPHDLIPDKVGVVQLVDSAERIARIRWFKDPKIELRSNGSVLAANSRYGAIGDVVEDISLYEIMSFPCLQRRPKDICIISTRSNDSMARHIGHSAAKPQETGIHPKLSDMQPQFMINSSAQNIPILGSARAERPDIDWCGEVVATGFDGSCTIRLGALHNCQDVCLSRDRILAVIDEPDEGADFDEDAMDLDSWGYSEYSVDSDFAISETVEYEGGERIDQDSGDENWESEDNEEEDTMFADAQGEVDQVDDAEMRDANESNPEKDHKDLSMPRLRLEELLVGEAPPQFMILDMNPPPDQHGLHTVATSGAFLKRISKEHRILSTSLPEGEIYVRTYENRLDLLRCLIIGPRDTPYENAPFLVDLHLPQGFPEEPPTAHFHSWTSGLGRINPNLYEEGKICLSLLGTWSGKHESEKWSDKATLLQLLVSLQGLVLVKKPFYNEAGYEGFENDDKYKVESELYSEKAYLMARGFVKHALTQPPKGLEDVLAYRYLARNEAGQSLLETVLERGWLLIKASEIARANKDEGLMDATGSKGDTTKVFLKALSRGASVMLERILTELKGQLEVRRRSISGVSMPES